MKTIITIFVITAMFALGAFGQTPNFASIGISTDGAKTAGTGLYARLVSGGSGTYAFSVVDAVPTSVRPFNVVTSFSAGIAQKLLTINNLEVYCPTAAGISYSGESTGWQWSTGALVAIPIKQTAWRIVPSVRVLKSNVDASNGYRLVAGIAIGWGW